MTDLLVPKYGNALTAPSQGNILGVMQVLGATRMATFWKERPYAKAALSALLARLSAEQAATRTDLAAGVGGIEAEGDVVINLEHARVQVRLAFDEATKSALIRSVVPLD
jgi:hypothetical protein